MKSFLTSFFLFTSFVGSTCSCWGPPNFCAAVSDSITVDDYVILGKKIDDIGHGMVIEVLKSYRSEVEEETIIIWGDLGWLCRVYSSRFVTGETYIFNINRIGNSNIHPSEGSNDFELSVCGLHYLSVKDGKVIGFINQSEAVQNVDLEVFNLFFEENDCASITSDISEIEAIVSPNPFTDEILIQSNHRISELELYDMTGRLILTEKASKFYHWLDLSDYRFTSGMYILRIVGYLSEERLIKIIKV